jgi:hypothetical protein
MRMISRKQALEIIGNHGHDPKDCVVSHARDGELWNGKTLEPYCESFDSYLGVHDSYAIIDVKNWLGY